MNLTKITNTDTRHCSTGTSAHRNDVDELKQKLAMTHIESPVVDETKPTTQILVRLVSGETATLVLNTCHRLRDLFDSIERWFHLSPTSHMYWRLIIIIIFRFGICSRHPSHGRPFQLRLSYPRRVFSASQATTEEELNSSLEDPSVVVNLSHTRVLCSNRCTDY